jgi:hypothetical protein
MNFRVPELSLEEKKCVDKRLLLALTLAVWLPVFALGIYRFFKIFVFDEGLKLVDFSFDLLLQVPDEFIYAFICLGLLYSVLFLLAYVFLRRSKSTHLFGLIKFFTMLGLACFLLFSLFTYNLANGLNKECSIYTSAFLSCFNWFLVLFTFTFFLFLHWLSATIFWYTLYKPYLAK